MIISVSQKEGSLSQSIFLNCLLGGGLGGGSQETSRSFSLDPDTVASYGKGSLQVRFS